MDQALRERAEQWIAQDPSAETRRELETLLARGDAAAEADIADRFAGQLEFGTAGLRGVLGAGPNRMNRAVVLRTTHGLATHLAAAVKDTAPRGVVIGYDGRRLSRELAEDTACVLAAMGIRAHLFDTVCPTPLTAFAVTHLGAAAGVMVTASHNPPEYNGYKVYWQNGAQIIPPIDADIARAIDAAPPAKDVPRLDAKDARAKGLVVTVPASVERAYLDAIARLRVGDGKRRDLRIAYTPLHGVGDRLAHLALAEAGFTDVTSVKEQAQPDGAFPTVAFPNPEEKGAMDLVLALARKKDAELVLANDPDADRLSVAVPDASAGGGWVQLTGNQVGVLLGHYLLTRGDRSGKRAVLASIVSSPMLGVMARRMGVRYEETLTGFKWIANRAMDLERDEGVRFVFGYEEALGYTVGDVVRDKDGVSAALLFAELAATLSAEGKTVHDALEAISREHGLFIRAPVSVVRKGAEGAAEITALMARLRKARPARIGDLEVIAVSDYYESRTRAEGDSTTPLTLPRTNMVGFDLAGQSRVLARPSGTEPKVKFYFDVREQVRPGEPFGEAEARARAAMHKLAAAFTALAGV